MSRNEWEEGSLLLPSKEVTRLRAALNQSSQRRRELVAAEVERLWPHLKGKTATTRKKMVRHSWSSFPDGVVTRRVHRGVVEPYSKYTHEALRLYGTADGKKPTAAVYERAGFAKPTNRTCQWDDEELSISLDGRTVRYSVGENNHSVDHARDSLLGTAFFQFLDNVTWTRGTGGELVGNDEYNQDTTYAGGGGNYVTARFGPLGAASETAERKYMAAMLRAAS